MEFNLIIDLPKSHEAQQVMFWGVGETVTTPDPKKAMLVTTEHLNRKLDRFDNGRTTRAVLKSRVDALKGNFEGLIKFEQEQAA